MLLINSLIITSEVSAIIGYSQKDIKVRYK